MKAQILLFSCLMLFALSCKSDKAKTPDTVEGGYPALPAEIFNQLKDQCDNIDIIFTSYPLSINLTGRDNALSVTEKIEAGGPGQLSGCPTSGTMTFTAQGKMIAIASFFEDPSCSYIAFTENNKVKYVNSWSPDGKVYIGNLIQLAQKNAENNTPEGQLK